MNYRHGCNYEGEEEMESKEACQGCIIYGEAAPNSLNKGVAYVGDSGEEVCNNRGASEGHLASG